VTEAAVPTGVATGIGSLPGDDIDAAAALVFETLPDLPHLPELPGRGLGADLVGRTAAVLTDLHVDWQPAGWRLVARPGVEERRAAALLERDLDALVPVAPGYDGVVKIQLCGPWTLAAALELPRGGKALGDTGAVRDLTESLVETVREQLAATARRLPQARLVLQLDEPSLPAAMAGHVPTASGLGRLRAVEPAAARAALAAVTGAVEVPVVVHCCATDVPVTLLHEAGAAAVSLDLTTATIDMDAVGAAVDGGLRLWLGVVPALGPGAAPPVREIVQPVRALWRGLGFAPDQLPAMVAVTPTCGLAGASPGWARTALTLATRAARALAEAPEGITA
jgi:hypothetical protein